jgi:hypothetical protein
LPLGNSDDAPALAPQVHVYVGSKAPWFELPADGLPRFDILPAGMAVPEAARFTVAFCSVCGGGVPRAATGVVSTTPSAADRLGAEDGAGGAPYLVVPAGSLDDDPGPLPKIHIFVGSKAPWYTIADSLEQCDEYPRGCASSHEWVARQSR